MSQWPSWRYDPKTSEGRIFNYENEVPPGWVDSPKKVKMAKEYSANYFGEGISPLPTAPPPQPTEKDEEDGSTHTPTEKVVEKTQAQADVEKVEESKEGSEEDEIIPPIASRADLSQKVEPDTKEVSPSLSGSSEVKDKVE